MSVLRKLRPFWLTARMQGAGTAPLLQLWTKKKEEPNMGEALRRPGAGEGRAGDAGASVPPPTCSGGPSRRSSCRPQAPLLPCRGPQPRWGPGEDFRKLAPKMPLYKGKGASTPPSSTRPPRFPPQPGLLLTQKLGASLVGAERLHLLLVLAEQAEPRRGGHSAVELGRDVLLGLAPGVQGKATLSAARL